MPEADLFPSICYRRSLTANLKGTRRPQRLLEPLSGSSRASFASTGGQRIYVGYSVAASAALKMVLHTLYDGVEKFTPSFRIGYR